MSRSNIESLFELSERRFDTFPTIFCTLYKREYWGKRFGGKAYTELIVEHYNYNVTRIETGDANISGFLDFDIFKFVKILKYRIFWRKMKAINKAKNYQKTKTACYLGFVTQAIVANFAPLLFLTFYRTYGISYADLALIPLSFYLTS